MRGERVTLIPQASGLVSDTATLMLYNRPDSNDSAETYTFAMADGGVFVCDQIMLFHAADNAILQRVRLYMGDSDSAARILIMVLHIPPGFSTGGAEANTTGKGNLILEAPKGKHFFTVGAYENSGGSLRCNGIAIDCTTANAIGGFIGGYVIA